MLYRNDQNYYNLIDRFAPALKITEIKNHEDLRFQIYISIMVQNMKVGSMARKSISFIF